MYKRQGGTIGEYVGIKFVSPDADHISWLSFGRLRPVHTNMVFWGWASLGIIGLGYYVVPTVSNAKIHNIRWGWNGPVSYTHLDVYKRQAPFSSTFRDIKILFIS